MDSEPTSAEIKVALDSLASGKAPGKDRTTSLLKCCKEIITTEVYEIFCLCWRESGVPQDMKDANLVTLYKNKGNRATAITIVASLFSAL